jgi:hypothetical protein
MNATLPAALRASRERLENQLIAEIKLPNLGTD